MQGRPGVERQSWNKGETPVDFSHLLVPTLVESLHCIGSLSLSPTPHPQPVIMEPLQGTNIHAFGDTAGGATAPTKRYSPVSGWNLTPPLSSSLNDGTDSVGPIVPAIHHTSCHACVHTYIFTHASINILAIGRVSKDTCESPHTCRKPFRVL